MAISKQSVGLAALAVTSTIGAWFMYSQFRPKKPKKVDGDEEKGPFDFIVNTSRPKLQPEFSESTSTLDSQELEQVFHDDEVDLKICRQLLLQKRQSNSRSRKVDLFDRLVTKLEATMDERDRMVTKLDRLRETAAEPVSKPNTVTTMPTDQVPDLKPHNDTSVCMVVQRYRGASIVCDGTECIQVGKPGASLMEPGSSDSFCGLMVYVSFAKGCTQQSVKAAARIVVNLPLLTTGAWGDGTSKTMNVVDLAKSNPNAASLMIVPQAGLINKVKREGKSIQYHGQIDKNEGETLYHCFVNQIRGLVLEKQCEARKEPLPEWYQKSCSAQSGSSPQRASPSIPPEDLFRDDSLYASWDEQGIPLTDAEDEPITKSAMKKLRKAQAAHRVRHLKWLREHRSESPTPSVEQEQPHQHVEHWATAIDPTFVKVVAGTYGKLQSLQFTADMGPFCHVVQV